MAVSALIAGAGRRAEALDDRGTVAAVAVGASVIAGTSWRGAALLGLFFVSGSALSKVNNSGASIGKSGRRDAMQVLANGGVAGIASLLSAATSCPRWSVAMAGSLATATSDTWATEIGSTSHASPRLLVSGKRVPMGLSGGVTARGTVGALLGAGAIGLLHAVTFKDVRPASVAVIVAGFGGCVFDSLLGELVQERRWSPASQRWVERPVDGGQPTIRQGGVPGVTNDVVNLAATIFGAVVAVGLACLFTSGADQEPADLKER